MALPENLAVTSHRSGPIGSGPSRLIDGSAEASATHHEARERQGQARDRRAAPREDTP